MSKTMKHLRYILMAVAFMLVGHTMQAQQYLNFFGQKNGSVPLDRFDSLLFINNSGSYSFTLTTQEGKTTLSTERVDSLTFSDKPFFETPVSTQRAYIKLTDASNVETIVEMQPVWNQPGYYFAMHFVDKDAGYVSVAYSFDRENWTLHRNSLYEGWNCIMLSNNIENYLSDASWNVSSWTGRTAMNGMYLVGDVTGGWNGFEAQWKLPVPVNAEGWWASPKFVADGEVHASMRGLSENCEDIQLTIHQGKVFWNDCYVGKSWTDNKGADYSVQGKAGQKLYVNFSTGEAMVCTAEEFPYALPNPIFIQSTRDEGCHIEGANGNTAVLKWEAVDGAVGYRIKMANYLKVLSGGSEVWDNADNILLDKQVDASVTELSIPNLDYSTNYRFAIQALSPRGDKYHSAWFGYGGPRYWYAYLNMMTSDRYLVPMVTSASQVKKTSVRININHSIADYNTYDQEEIRQHFNFTDADKTLVRVDYITVEPSILNPDVVVPEQYQHYTLTATDLEKGYVDIDGLDEYTAYLIKAWDATIETSIDACYNVTEVTTKGTPGAPILLNHDVLMESNVIRLDTFALSKDYQAAPLSPTLRSYHANMKMAEGQVFYLEGGKTYYLDGNDFLYKGLTLATYPDDVAAGKRARVICGIGKHSIFSQATNGEQWQGPYTLFLLGRQPETGEIGSVLSIEKIAFKDIDFDNPKALNYGDSKADAGNTTGNFFFNMYSDGLSHELDSLVIENCTFKRLVRGFIREQGPNYKVWNHVLIKNNQFFDCGYYTQGAGGYSWIHGSGQNVASNLYKDMKVIENTFYDSPFPAFFSEQSEVEWTSGAWNITFANNTLINFNTRADGSIFKMRRLPDGSVYNVKNNLFVLCKQAGDQRILAMWGADIRNTQYLADGSAGKVTLNFDNNWSTNNDLTNGSIFSAKPWTSTSNNFGKLIKNGLATLNGTLDVNVADISAVDLMESPCPPHVAATAVDQNMHRAEALDGTASEYNVNLYFKNTDNAIYKNNVGAARWRNK